MGIADDISIKKPKKPAPVEEEKKTELAKGEVEVPVKRKSDNDDEHIHLDETEHKLEMADDFFALKPEGQEDKVPTSAQGGVEIPADSVGNDKPMKKKKKGSGITKWVILLVIILIGLLVWQNYSRIRDIFGLNSETDTSDTSNSFQPQDYTTTPASTPESTAPATSTDTAAATPALNRGSVTLQILNGNGISGSAASVKTALTTAGYSVGSVTNAAKFTYPDTIIYYKTGKTDYANDVKSVLSSRTCEISENNTITSKYDIVVVVGKT